jgi:predicted short-subunit dehydrogenase-like oxidoreductase (DUF2520 family)
MNVVLIGSGNVAWNLGRLIKKARHEVLQVVSTNSTTATELAYVLDTESTTYWSILNPDADIYLVAVNDNALPDVAAQLRLKKGLVLHTSGTAPISVFSASSSKYGVLYPLQSLLAGSKEVPIIPFLAEGNNEAVTAEIVQFAHTLAHDVKIAATEQRQKMHLAAVLVNNFTNYLLVEAENWCVKNGLDFKQLLPLLKETATRVKGNDTASLQTGPAVRNDTVTIELHRQLLTGEPKLLDLYNYITGRILDKKLG